MRFHRSLEWSEEEEEELEEGEAEEALKPPKKMLMDLSCFSRNQMWGRLLFTKLMACSGVHWLAWTNKHMSMWRC